MDQSFAGWLWQDLKNIIGISAKSRSEKERKIGMFLLISQVAWLILPPNPIKFALHISHILLGLVLTLHGDYLWSIEVAEENRKWEASRNRQYEERLEQLREMIIEQIAEADGISIEEAAEKADERKWFDSRGNAVQPPWMRETEEEAEG